MNINVLRQGTGRQKIMNWFVERILQVLCEYNFDLLLLFPATWTLPHFQGICQQSVNCDFVLHLIYETQAPTSCEFWGFHGGISSRGLPGCDAMAFYHSVARHHDPENLVLIYRFSLLCIYFKLNFLQPLTELLCFSLWYLCFHLVY